VFDSIFWGVGGGVHGEKECKAAEAKTFLAQMLETRVLGI